MKRYGVGRWQLGNWSCGLLLAALLVLVAVPTTPVSAQASAGVTTFSVGTSVQGRSIDGLRIGSGPRSLVLVGAIHGNEGNSHVLVNDLAAYFSSIQHLFPPDLSLYIIPALNPDGLNSNSRYNANGVDLNRNWDTPNWQPDTSDASGRVAGGGGPHPFSEPETAAMAGWLLAMREQSSQLRVIFYHSAYPPYGLVLGGSVGAPFTPAYADVVGYGKPSPSRPGWSAYPVTGVAPGWCGDNGIGCFEVELPSRANLNDAQMKRHATAVLSVMMWQQTAPGQRCFLETGWCVAGDIGAFWARHGGRDTFGLPLEPEQPRMVDGVPRQVQLFERARLEWHPERARPYRVQVGRTGIERLEQQGRSWFTFARSESQEGCRFFEETGQNICGPILDAWSSHGIELDGQRGTSEAESLALFGMPVSPPQTETLANGQTHTVQWFERARFEIHPDLPAPFTVQRGLLGREIHQSGQ
jgi:hypothetical protein